MSERVFIITKENVLTMLQTLAAFIKDAITRGNVMVTLSREKRTNDQNSLLWALLTDISRQMVWHGQKLSAEDWKHIFSAAWKGQKVLPGIDGNLVVFGQPTSKLNKSEFSELIEIIYHFIAENEIALSERSTAIYDDYKEKK